MRVRTTAAALLTLGLLLTACGGGAGQTDLPPKAGPPEVVPMQLAPEAPMLTVQAAADQISQRLVIAPSSVGAFGADDVRDAAKWLSYYLARAHADTSWLCSKSKTSPTHAFASPTLRDHLATKDGKSDLSFLESKLDDRCDWLAPGVVIGQQTLRPSTKSGYPRVLVVEYRGDYGYAPKTSEADALFLGEFRATFWLKRKGSGWELFWSGPSYKQLQGGWPAGVALPHAFAARTPVTPLPKATPDAWRAVSEGRHRTMTSTAVSWASTVAWTAEAGGGKADKSQTTGTLAPAQGWAQLNKGSQLVFDAGRLDLTQRGKDKLRARVGETVPNSATWIAHDPTALGFGSLDDSNPFAVLAFLGHATSAADATCSASQKQVGATHCLTARVATSNAAYSNSVASRLGWGHLTAGTTALDVQVGLDEEGRIASIGWDIFPAAKGEAAPATITNSLTQYTSTAPTRPATPAESLIVKDGTFYTS